MPHLQLPLAVLVGLMLALKLRGKHALTDLFLLLGLFGRFLCHAQLVLKLLLQSCRLGLRCNAFQFVLFSLLSLELLLRCETLGL